MFQWIGKTWQLFKFSFGIVWSDKSLLQFPFCGGVCLLVFWASALGPLAWQPQILDWLRGDQLLDENQKLFRRVLFGSAVFSFYFVQYFIIVFFNSALVASLSRKFAGERPTFRQGIRLAAQRSLQIAGWAFVMSTVVMFFRIANQHLNKPGRVLTMIGMKAWTVAALLGVPVLVNEGLGPWKTLTRSLEILRTKWGESLIVNVSLATLNSLLICLGLVVGTIASVVAGAYFNSVIAAFVPLGLIVVFAGFLWLIESAVMQVFMASVYIYAATDRIPDGLNEELLRSAFIATPNK